MPARKTSSSSVRSIRTLAIILGDQLDANSPVLRGLDPRRDAVLMMEVMGESRHVPSHAHRTALFLSAMRHFAENLRSRDLNLRYITLTDRENTQSFEGEIARAIAGLRPERLRVLLPGEWRVKQIIEAAAKATSIELEILDDPHFYSTPAEFSAWATPRKSMLNEDYYRHLRKKAGVLMNADGTPVGGAWNFDKENRQSFGKGGPSTHPPKRFKPDAITRAVIEDVRQLLPDLPGIGALEHFDWPVTRAQALEALKDFLKHRLAHFGEHQDAMWTGEPWLNHALLSTSLNLKLLDPRECLAGALHEYEQGRAPLNSVEGFIRQILGWREYIRGVYWHAGPTYADRNTLDAHAPLPEMYWTGQTKMACMKHALGQVLEHGYGHHIQRLMVTGNFALLLGVEPKAISDWYLGIYVDGIDWVTLPNTLGMSQHADGGVEAGGVGTKPYAASGKYIDRMSNYCRSCAYDLSQRSGESACPFNVLYWDFLLRHQERFAGNHRMWMMVKNARSIKPEERVNITVSASKIRKAFASHTMV
jgi:deoxyribodipyrimidine photolyase-related protein